MEILDAAFEFGRKGKPASPYHLANETANQA